MMLLCSWRGKVPLRRLGRGLLRYIDRLVGFYGLVLFFCPECRPHLILSLPADAVFPLDSHDHCSNYSSFCSSERQLLFVAINMRLIIRDDAEAASVYVANYVVDRIKHFNPTPAHPFVLGLPTGSSPLIVYKHLVEKYKAGEVNRHLLTTQDA